MTDPLFLQHVSRLTIYAQELQVSLLPYIFGSNLIWELSNESNLTEIILILLYSAVNITTLFCYSPLQNRYALNQIPSHSSVFQTQSYNNLHSSTTCRPLWYIYSFRSTFLCKPVMLKDCKYTRFHIYLDQIWYERLLWGNPKNIAFISL